MTQAQRTVVQKMSSIHSVEITELSNGDIGVLSHNKNKKVNLYYIITPKGGASLESEEKES